MRFRKWLPVILILAFVIGGVALFLLLPEQSAPRKGLDITPVPTPEATLTPEALPEDIEEGEEELELDPFPKIPPGGIPYDIDQEDGEKPAPFSPPDEPNDIKT